MLRHSLFRLLRSPVILALCVAVLIGLVQPHLEAQPAATSFEPIFDQVWETIDEKFYDPNFNGIDWSAMRDRYRPAVVQAQSRQQAAEVINQMLAELNTSHTRFYTPDEPAYYQLLGVFLPRSTELQDQLAEFLPEGKSIYRGIGIFTESLNGKTFIKALLDDGPADEAGLLMGDEIISVNGQPFHPIRSFESTEPVTVTIRRSPDGSPQDITVTPQQFDATTMFLEAQIASTEVIDQGDKKVGYVHIWSYAGDQYHEQLERELLYGDLKDADALVVDLREGWGGASTNYLNVYNQRSLSLTSIPRDGGRYTSRSAWTKPVVLLVNEGSRSGKEILAYGFQQLQIGPVVGSKTAGAVVAGSPFLMQDGSLLYVAVTDVFLDDNFRLEGLGITPDVEVPLPLEYAQGVDPQKDQAATVAAALVTPGV
jgi:carboxyl-terminal processing protease